MINTIIEIRNEAAGELVAPVARIVEEVVARAVAVEAATTSEETASVVEATPADELAAIATRVEEVVTMIPAVVEAVTPADELAGIVARVAASVAYAPEEGFTATAGELAAIATRVATTVTYAAVEEFGATADELAGIAVRVAATVAYAAAAAEVGTDVHAIDDAIVVRIIGEATAPVPTVTGVLTPDKVEAVIAERVKAAISYTVITEALTPDEVKAAIATRIHEVAEVVAYVTAVYEGTDVSEVDVALVARIIGEVIAPIGTVIETGTSEETASAVEATTADELAEMNARVEEVVARVPKVGDADTPADELATIAARAAVTVAYAAVEKFGASDAEATAIAESMVTLALARVPKVAEAVTPDEVKAAIALALVEVGIEVD